MLARLVDKLTKDTGAVCPDEFALTNVADAEIFAVVRHVTVVCTTTCPTSGYVAQHRQSVIGCWTYMIMNDI